MTEIVNTEDIDPTEMSKRQTEFKRWKLAEKSGGENLGCSIYEIPAGKKSFPYHYHTANEEAIYVLRGEGTLRLDGEKHGIEEGDYIALPPDEEGAHQVINTSDSELRYLTFSTMTEPDVAFYPDTDKVGIYVGSPPGGSKEERTHTKYFRQNTDIDYWDGE